MNEHGAPWSTTATRWRVHSRCSRSSDYVSAMPQLWYVLPSGHFPGVRPRARVGGALSALRGRAHAARSYARCALARLQRGFGTADLNASRHHWQLTTGTDQ
jgi:hypothetical protein